MPRRIVQVLTGVILGLATVAVILMLRPPPEIAVMGGALQRVDPEPYPAEDFTLIAHNGRRVSLSDFRGRTVALFFGFSHCPDVCPATLMNLSTALERMGEEGRRVQGLLVSVDPERDTPERLRDYMRAFDPSLLALTGPLEEIRRAADDYGVYFRRASEEAGQEAPHHDHGSPGEAGPSGHGTEEGEGYLVDHTARVFVIDADGFVVTSLAPLASPDEIRRELMRVAAGR